MSDEAFRIISLILSSITPILLVFISRRIEKQSVQETQRFESERERENYLRELQEKLRADRIQLYNNILEPYIIALSNDNIKITDPKYKNKPKQQIVNEILLGMDYRKYSFQLILMGSDNVVKAFNDLMQYFYSYDESKADPKDNLKQYLGNFLLEIRRSVGNEDTTISNIETLEWMITDIRQSK